MGDVGEQVPADERDALIEDLFEIELSTAALKEVLGCAPRGTDEDDVQSNVRPPEMPAPIAEEDEDETPKTQH